MRRPHHPHWSLLHQGRAHEVCFEFGVELDEITSEHEEASKSATTRLSKEELEALLDLVVYKIDVPANRHDLLCVEGLSWVLRVFFGEMDSPNYTFANPASGIMETMMVAYSNTFKIRPFFVCAGRCFSCMFDFYATITRRNTIMAQWRQHILSGNKNHINQPNPCEGESVIWKPIRLFCSSSQLLFRSWSNISKTTLKEIGQ